MSDGNGTRAGAARLTDAADRHYDAIVVGAGFAGLYALHRLRADGLRVRVLEAADSVGGTWLFNRYPGARCDIESIEYSYSFSPELQQEWNWSEVLPGQPEIEAYLNFVADRLDLRRDIQFDTRVVEMSFDEADSTWTVRTEAGESFTAPFVVAATGILSAPLDPGIPGLDTFGGTVLFSSQYPREGFDLAGRRVAVIGTGSTGVQIIPVVAEQAEHLYVLQRSAAYTLPSPARPYEPGELDELKANYDDIRAAQLVAHVGAARTSAFSVFMNMGGFPPLKTATREEQLRAIEENGVRGALYWSDVLSDPEAGELATALYGEAVALIVRDPRTAAGLTPTYPFGCKRPIIDVGYYETFNRDNVTLVDLRQGAIEEITPTGIRTGQGHHEVDVILFATGFDALTGALTRIDVRGRGGVVLGDVWRDEGPVAYLGLGVAGFPNLFLIQGPGSPSAASNYLATMEYQIRWIADCVAHLRGGGHQTIETLPEAQSEWIDGVQALVAGSVLLHPKCDSWYNGANVPGKKRMYTTYVAGVPEFHKQCDQVVAAGYSGFKIS
ncbi:Predicted flavoprotein CzcO associated with the cation diffusion facilitator CzcD [Parafrankia irregularis]|uniref:Predicted flavoprotein CzcO associated with the cation diffusion facilitator CzcD n=1 Tax=Parafrankia irregularis TaxID=795642 RepID=A0A0S4QUU6_9ACTN|nr:MULTISPECIES: NAD(P)/FAD-dependent oxidoreductase [Parafrankia]CUU58234.1 Predicted flavoprotein CzcO associated with the cation diffusion facilitator CzcD [Parafrankia irregularis]